jgi:hypothetical protein
VGESPNPPAERWKQGNGGEKFRYLRGKPVSIIGNDVETVETVFPQQAPVSFEAREEDGIIDLATLKTRQEKAPNDPEAFGDLSESEQQELLGWIAATIRSVRRRSPGAYCPSSYYLKHEFERSSNGFYITNGQFKGAMQEAGIEGVDKAGDGIDLSYGVSIDARSADT